MPLTKEQAAHLSQRIQDFWTNHRFASNPPAPPKVITAKKLVDEFNAKCDAANRARSAKVAAAVAAARQAVHFSEPAEALAAVKKLETTQF